MNGRTNVVNNNNDSLGGIIPLEAPNNFVVVADNAKCLLTWTDPKDKYADELGEITDEGDQLVSQFAYTRIVRKATGFPSGPNDGDIVTESSTRNQYQSTAYSDEGLVNNTLYYYAAFTCNTDGVWSGSVTGSATPKAYDPILANNTWEQINEVANEGIAASVWNIGDEIDITALNETLTMVILDFDHDTLSDGSGTAAITFGMKNLMKDKATIEKVDAHSSNAAWICYWNSTIKKYLIETVQPSLSVSVSRFIKNVNKKSIRIAMDIYSSGGRYDGSFRIESQKTESYKIFPFALSEVTDNLDIGYSHYDDPTEYLLEEGALYNYYTTSSNRIKKLANGTGNTDGWYLRTSYFTSSNYSSYSYYYSEIDETGEYSDLGVSFVNPSSYPTAICFGFCIGKTPS